MAQSACPLVSSQSKPRHAHQTHLTHLPRHSNPMYTSRHQQHRPRVPRWRPPTMSSFLITVALMALMSLIPVTNAAVVAEPTPVQHATTRAAYDDSSFNIILRTEHERLEKYELSAVKKRQDATNTIEIAISTDGADSAATTTVITSPLPSPFDSNLAANFRGNDGDGECPKFINSFLTSETFKDCYPFSLLVQGSTGFFEAEKSAVSMTQILQATCSANVQTCAPYLEGLANDLMKEEYCKEDYDLQNSVVMQAYAGLIAYKELYAASCLQDPEQGGFCFTSAVTNFTTPSNVYLYYLPLNQSLPGSSSPSCDWCVQNTMNIFQSASANRRLPISKTYAAAAQQINQLCGPVFVNETLPAATVLESGGVGFQGAAWMGMMTAMVVGLGLGGLMQVLI